MRGQRTGHTRLGLLLMALVAVVLLGVVGFGLAKDVVRSDSPLPPLTGEKGEIEERVARLRAEALAQPRPPKYPGDPNFDPKGPLPPNSQPTPQPPPSPWPQIARIPAGAGTIIDAPFPLKGLTSRNQWYEVKDGKSITAYAGAEGYAFDPSQGVVLVVVETLDFQPVPSAGGTYRTPVKAGPVRIVGAEGEVLTLVAEDGTKFLFDVASRRFLSPDTLLPLPAPPTPTPRPTVNLPPIASVAIDTDAARGAANSATSLGPLDACAALSKPGTVTIDVTVDAVPPVLASDGGIAGFQFLLHYDPSVVKVAGSDYNMLLTANSGSSPVSLGDSTPDADGSFMVAVGDLGQSTPESGPGVLARITLQGVSKGVSPLTLTDVLIVDSSGNSYAIGSVEGAQVVVDGACP